MDADSVAEAVFGLHPSGPMVIHVVDNDYEYWLEVTEVKSASLVDPPWTGGVIIETKPIPAGVMARRPVFTPRPFFRPSVAQAKTPTERLQELQTEGALDFIPQDKPKVSGVRISDMEIDIRYRVIDRYPADTQFRISDHKPIYVTPPQSSGVVDIPVDPHYGRPPTIDDIATKSPEQLAQMYPNDIPSFTPHDLASSLTSESESETETENLQPPRNELRFRQYRDPFVGAGTEHLAEELAAQHRMGDNVDASEPHYAVAREINERDNTEE